MIQYGHGSSSPVLRSPWIISPKTFKWVESKNWQRDRVRLLIHFTVLTVALSPIACWGRSALPYSAMMMLAGFALLHVRGFLMLFLLWIGFASCDAGSALFLGPTQGSSGRIQLWEKHEDACSRRHELRIHKWPFPAAVSCRRAWCAHA